ncbi:MAG TPA: hypothetical protein VN688_01165 [Gemmataceae bacterium]|nr:hypothetical protein [Gemmataceae bacterium]
MIRESLPLEMARQVTPRALRTYAESLGWKPVPNGKRPWIAIFHRPDSELHQILVPMDETLEDYGDMVGEVVRKLAEFEKLPAQAVLNHLLLPPADVLRFREVSPDAEAGHLPFEHAVGLINGTRRLLLSVAHSVLVPQPYHPRLSRSEAEEFIGRCRLGQTERGSFALTVSCPLELQLSLPGMGEPFARQVTTLLMESLEALAQASDAPKGEELSDLARNPGLSANLCEALLMLRPSGDRASLTVSATWSRALLPSSRKPSRQVQLHQETFEMAEVLAPRMRSQPQPRPARFIGFVDALRGQPTSAEARPAGEVAFTLFDDAEGEIHARAQLTADDYASAGAAHLASGLVFFKGVLRRLPRGSWIDSITDFERVMLDEDGIPADAAHGS